MGDTPKKKIESYEIKKWVWRRYEYGLSYAKHRDSFSTPYAILKCKQ